MVNTASSLHSISKVLFGNTSSNSQKHFVKFATEMVAVKAGVSGNSHFPQFPAGNASLKIPSEWHFLFPFFPEIRESNFCDFQFPFPGVKKTLPTHPWVNVMVTELHFEPIKLQRNRFLAENEFVLVKIFIKDPRA